jgi:hypothetical protein
MKQGKSRLKPVTGHLRNESAPVVDRRLVPANEAHMRKRAVTELNRAMAKLDKARAEWRRFEQEDRPAFAHWIDVTFGALLTNLRDNARLISEQEHLIEEVEMEMMWGHRNPRKAYATVMKRRQHPDTDDGFTKGNRAGRRATPEGARDAHGDEDDASHSFDPFRKMGADIPEAECRAMFDDFLKSVVGINPEHMCKAEYSRMFAHFEADLLGKGRQDIGLGMSSQHNSSTGRDEARIKEVYRTLVRRLHPDLQTDDTKVSTIWHDVQEAYEARNLDRLETLLSLTEVQSGANGGNASLSQMLRALEELSRGVKAIQRSIREAKRDPAWRFCQAENRVLLERRIRREMEDSIAEQQWVLDGLKRTLDDWSRPWNPPAKKPKKKPNSSVTPEPEQPG